MTEPDREAVLARAAARRERARASRPEPEPPAAAKPGRLRRFLAADTGCGTCNRARRAALRALERVTGSQSAGARE